MQATCDKHFNACAIYKGLRFRVLALKVSGLGFGIKIVGFRVYGVKVLNEEGTAHMCVYINTHEFKGYS